jgi:hypothetical protein
MRYVCLERRSIQENLFLDCDEKFIQINLSENFPQINFRVLILFQHLLLISAVKFYQHITILKCVLDQTIVCLHGFF